ncbi:MAG TPA: allantoate amidohydrolase [Granulicella sp.]|jgi:allantoate deiminase|nr:allantoate amidohydrolase [Granulicella sp.]
MFEFHIRKEPMTVDHSRRSDRIVARCRALAACTETPGETTRTFLSPPMHAVHEMVRGWMEAAAMRVWVDAVGNLRGVYAAASGDEAGPRLLVGSHLDTVPNAGAFDGPLGVLLGVAMVEELQGERLPFAIEVVAFSEEEGVRFGRPFLGSLALVGEVDDAWLARRDARGVSVEEAIREFGLDPAGLPEAVLDENAFAYVEVHIEQGPVLEREALGLGVVSSIAGQSRLELTFLGQANHAGTTPMLLRHDAMAAAAAWIVAVEQYARGQSGLVATVGRVETRPGAGNVIAGEVVTTLDVRHAEDEVRERAEKELLAAAEAEAHRRGVRVAKHVIAQQAAMPMDGALTELLGSAAERAGYRTRAMVSGAGHDAMIVGRRLPAAMLFVRSPGGLSHHPEERVLVEDVEAALATGMELLRGLDVGLWDERAR